MTLDNAGVVDIRDQNKTIVSGELHQRLAHVLERDPDATRCKTGILAEIQRELSSVSIARLTADGIALLNLILHSAEEIAALEWALVHKRDFAGGDMIAVIKTVDLVTILENLPTWPPGR